MRFPGFPSAILRDILKSVITEYTLNKRLAMVVKAVPVDDLVSLVAGAFHDDVIKWKHFPRNWPFVREIHRSPMNFPHKGQWRGALMFSLMYACINDWVNNREAGDLRLQHGHYDVIVMPRHSGNSDWVWFSTSSQLGRIFDVCGAFY